MSFEKHINIYSINNNFDGYQKLCKFFHESTSQDHNVTISIHNWFSANLCSPLGGIIHLENKRGVLFRLDTSNICTKIFDKNGFNHKIFSCEKQIDTYNTTVPFDYFKSVKGDENVEEFISYLDNLISKTVFPKLTEGAQKCIKKALSEIYINASMHSKGENVYVCGQYFPTKDELDFTITDTGIGFKKTIDSRYPNNDIKNDIEAIEWCLKKGNTTKKSPGGLGLDLLLNFLKLNNGKLQIVSKRGFYSSSNDNIIQKELKYPFPGSIINMQINTADNKTYTTKEEIKKDDIL